MSHHVDQFGRKRYHEFLHLVARLPTLEGGSSDLQQSLSDALISRCKEPKQRPRKQATTLSMAQIEELERAVEQRRCVIGWADVMHVESLVLDGDIEAQAFVQAEARRRPVGHE
eukprot:5212782-Amphidinium_carterae.1